MKECHTGWTGRVVAGVLVVSTAGCGTIFGGSSQEISLSSSPAGAAVEVDRLGRTVATPTEVELKRKHSYRLTFSREGYEPQTVLVESKVRAGILVLDILAGVVGVAVDAATGAWYKLTPDHVSVVLEKIDDDASGPDRLRVEARVGEDGGTTLGVIAEEPVRVRIERQ